MLFDNTNQTGHNFSKKKKMLWILKMRWIDLFFGNSKQITVNLIC